MVEEMTIDLGCEEWSIEDIHVHGKSQFAQPGAIPGDVFSPNSFDLAVRLETVQTAMNFSIKAAYHGANPRGRFFGATCKCQVVR